MLARNMLRSVCAVSRSFAAPKNAARTITATANTSIHAVASRSVDRNNNSAVVSGPTKRSFKTNVSLMSHMDDPWVQHVDTEYNNADTPWDFTPASYEEINKILAKYPKNGRQSGTLPLLHLAQYQNGGWIPLAAMNKIADILEIPRVKVYEAATFYSMFNRTPVGKYHIQVCVTTPCMIVGSDDIIAAIEKHLNIHMGETTADGLFTLGEMECMGACVNAPMIVISDYSNPPAFSYDFYEDLTPERTIEIIEMIRRGEKPPIGPQNGRKNSMGIQGKTTLFEEPPGPYCRDLDAPPAQPQQPQPQLPARSQIPQAQPPYFQQQQQGRALPPPPPVVAHERNLPPPQQQQQQQQMPSGFYPSIITSEERQQEILTDTVSRVAYNERVQQKTGEAISRLATNSEVQERVGNSVANAARNKEMQARVGNSIAANSDNKFIKMVATNEKLQEKAGEAFAKTAANKEMQQRAGNKLAEARQCANAPAQYEDVIHFI
eukprot:GEZU01024282.1.p1 GENE.GEZU01024282.1~~GEZU01024282.1.p1  ORF type:complete len:492 (-),score=154.58 GEZU01024282.1:252-1727(-)